MFRIVRTRTLDSLRAEIGRQREQRDEAVRKASRAYSQAADLRDWATAAEAEARSAKAALAGVQAKFDALSNDTAAALVRLWNLGEIEPERAHSFQAELALNILRGRIAEIRASGDPELINGIEMLDAVIGEDGRKSAAEALRSLAAG